MPNAHLLAQLLEAHRLMTLGHMVPGIIHKQNNLFNALIGYCELALRQLEPDHPAYEDIAGARQVALEAAAHTTRLVETIQHLQVAQDIAAQHKEAERHAEQPVSQVVHDQAAPEQPPAYSAQILSQA